MARVRWSDERIEDLAKLVLDNDQRLDKVQVIASDAKNGVEEINKRDAVHARSRVEQVAILAALASPFVTLLLGLLYHTH